jgi:argininosuccinate lyase
MMDALAALALAVAAMTGMVRDMQPDASRMKKMAGEGFATATDLADWIVRELKMPFREAHHAAARIVGRASEAGIPLHRLPLADMQAVEPKINDGVFSVLSVGNSVRSRVSYGGTAPKNVRMQAKRWIKKLDKERK